MDLDDEELEATRRMNKLKHMNNIEILEDLIFELRNFRLDKLSFKRVEVIENLIQENKELKELNEFNDIYKEVINSSMEKDYIPKSKVKEKLEELQDEFEYLGEDNKRVNKMAIEILQELLEGGE